MPDTATLLAHARGVLGLRIGAVARRVLGIILAAGVVSGAQSATTASTLADDRVEASYNSGDQFVHDAELDQLLARVGKQVQAANSDAMCVPLRIHALDLPLPYAFVLKNGAFYVSTGLIARLESEPEFAALVVLPLAALCRGDAEKLQSDQRQRGLKNLVPNLLLITLTAGLGAPSIVKSDRLHSTEESERLREASDAVALHWLASAGYAPTAAPLAMTHLLDGLAVEDRSGEPEFSNPAELTARRTTLEHLLAQTESDATAAPAARVATPPPASMKDPFRLISRRYALRLARTDVDSHPSGLRPWLDRIDALDGPSGYTAYLRAEFSRRDSGSDAGMSAAIASYEKCVSFNDAPAAAYRELGFLYRQAGDPSRARASLSKYLQQAPTAVDAPIIRTYLEVP